MGKQVITGFSFAPATLLALREYCKANDKKLSRVVERAVLEYLKTQGVTPPDNPTAK